MCFFVFLFLTLLPCSLSFGGPRQRVLMHQLIQDISPYKNSKSYDLEKWKLKNGLTLLLVHHSNPNLMCHFGILIPAGLADDPLRTGGKTAQILAHLIAHAFGKGLDFSVSLDSTFFQLQSNWEEFTSDLSRFFSLLSSETPCPFNPQLNKKDIFNLLKEKKNLSPQQDKSRLWSSFFSQLEKSSLNRPNSPEQNMILKNQTANQFKQWFDCYYTAEESVCFVSTPRPIHEVRNIILNTLDQMRQKIITKPVRLSPECKDSSFIFVTIQEEPRCLSFIWPFFEGEYSEKQNPLYLLASLLHTNYPENLLSKLSSLQWATKCEAHLEKLGQSLPTLFCIHINLTEKGVVHWKEIGSFVELFLNQAASIQKEEIQKLFSILKKEELLWHEKNLPLSIEKILKNLAKESLETFPFFSFAPIQLDPYRYKASIQKLLNIPKIILLGGSLSDWEKIKGQFIPQDQKSENLENYFFPLPSFPKRNMMLQFAFPKELQLLPPSQTRRLEYHACP